MTIDKSWAEQDDWADNKMTRKNKRLSDIFNNCRLKHQKGVDLNRNYGYKFGTENRGASTNPCADDYPGTQAFSEPETQAVKSLVETNADTIQSAINFHSYGNLWIYPFNYLDSAANEELKNNYVRFD
jgi:Zinc carboxypeptidase